MENDSKNYEAAENVRAYDLSININLYPEEIHHVEDAENAGFSNQL